MTPGFERALQQVLHDARLDDGHGADLVAAGVSRKDCLILLSDMLNGERITPEWMAVLVQVSVATGVWLERERWQARTEAAV